MADKLQSTSHCDRTLVHPRPQRVLPAIVVLSLEAEAERQTYPGGNLDGDLVGEGPVIEPSRHSPGYFESLGLLEAGLGQEAVDEATQGNGSLAISKSVQDRSAASLSKLISKLRA